MKNFIVAPYVAWSTLLSGVIGLVGIIFLLLFYALEAPAMLEGQPARSISFGTLNDATYIFVALLLLPAALALYRATRTQSPTWSLLGLILGVVGLLMMAGSLLVLVSDIVNEEQVSAFTVIATGVAGAWTLLICTLWGSVGSPPRGLIWLGIASGVGMLLLPITFFLAGSPQASDLQAEMPSIPAIIGFVLGVLGFTAWPIWVMWLGRFFMSHRLSSAE